MEYVYAVETGEQLARYQCFADRIRPALDGYIAYLQKEFQVADLPKTILWTSRRIATELLSDIPVPAFTNSHRIVMTCDLEAWQELYLSQLDGFSEAESTPIRHYYRNCLNHHHILQILGHELAHHSEWFLEEAYDSGRGIWFEEGMVELISRRYFLTEEEYALEDQINRQLLALNCACVPLDAFGQATYQEGYRSIFRAYWQSFLAVSQVVESFGGDLRQVFASYHRWYETGSELSLEDWFRADVHK